MHATNPFNAADLLARPAPGRAFLPWPSAVVVVVAALVAFSSVGCGGATKQVPRPTRSDNVGRGGGAGGQRLASGADQPNDDADDDAFDPVDSGPVLARERAKLIVLDAERATVCRRWSTSADAAAQLTGIDPQMLLAIAWVESGFVATARSSAGARGPMQLLPSTSRAFGCKDPEEPDCAMAASARFLARLLQRFEGDWLYALSAYNTGGARAARAFSKGELPPNQWYVERVLAARAVLARGLCVEGSGA